jgi:tRNA A-37 threonylcarbamoyl transferase component Bud32
VYERPTVALTTLHEARIVHGDDRMEKVLLDPQSDRRVLLVDLRRARVAASPSDEGLAVHVARELRETL